MYPDEAAEDTLVVKDLKGGNGPAVLVFFVVKLHVVVSHCTEAEVFIQEVRGITINLFERDIKISIPIKLWTVLNDQSVPGALSLELISRPATADDGRVDKVCRGEVSRLPEEVRKLIERAGGEGVVIIADVRDKHAGLDPSNVTSGVVD